MNFIFVGDPHVKKDNLESSRKLIPWVGDLALRHNAVVLFSGDQYNDFGVAQVLVMKFWNWAYSVLKDRTVSLIGNHDMNPDASATAMIAHHDQTLLVGTDVVVLDAKKGIHAIGFIRNEMDFHGKVMDAYRKGCRFMVCHAEFDGCQFENGFYSPHGFKLDLYPQDLIFVSGHIHKRQTLTDKTTGNVRCIYPGSPRMLTRSDIGQVKTIMLWDTEAGQMTDIEVPEHICPRFQHIVVTEENVGALDGLPDDPMIYVDLQGSKEFIKKASKKVGDKIKLRTLPDPEERRVSTVKESDGISKTFHSYAKDFLSKNSLTAEESKQIMDMVYEKMPELKV